MKLFLALTAFALAGCQSWGGYNTMSPEQIAAATKDKSAFCLTIIGQAGVAKLVTVDLAKGSNVAVNAETCNVVTTSGTPTPIAAPTPKDKP